MDFPRSEATAATEAYSNLNMACAALAGHARDILATALDSVELGDFALPRTSNLSRAETTVRAHPCDGHLNGNWPIRPPMAGAPLIRVHRAGSHTHCD
jgi:hypothetical protein